MNIQWFPGHMTKARRKMAEDIKLVDAVCEVLDARIPRSSSNPDMAELTAGKPRLVILNRADLADPGATRRWGGALISRGFGVLETDCKSGRGVDKFPEAARALCSDLLARRAERGQTGKTLRVMVVGIPNVGKSSFINRVARRRAAETSDRPGVTRGKQWINCGNGIELLDTPGILWPKFDDAATGENLAITGAVKDEILDIELLGTRLMLRLWAEYRGRVAERYKLRDGDEPDPENPLEIIARRRGYVVSGGEADTRRAAIMLLDEFRGGKLGRVTLELPE
ncbi:MAG: ribosome biogenesis GTPase YlqF [Oscillospiraceae bacterium]|jgi:ribosome biogenesis GTPase A|nr:ribosome biogenesis GTPase YlqF [Oscillospiraceae bacterium]